MKLFSNLAFLSIILFSSCSLVGVRMQVHNPKKSSIAPVISQEMQELSREAGLRSNYDVVFYDLDININAESKEVGGKVEIRCKALRDIDSLQFDLDEPLAIDEILVTGHTVSIPYTRKFRSVVFSAPARIKEGTIFSMLVKYHGKPIIAKRPPWVGGTVWKKDKDRKDWLGVACESEGASIWFPCKDLTSDEPDSVKIRLTIPDDGLKAVSNGVLIDEEAIDGKRSFTWRVHNPINLYNITYYIGDFVRVDDSFTGIDGQQLAITHYVLKKNEELARLHFQKVKEQIRVYEEIYGAYPFYSDGFKLVESPYAGMEHQSAIAYGNKYKLDLYGMEDYIMLHEVGHEWFGNAVTVSDLADVWLQEGVTTYGESLYLERQYGKMLALRHLYVYRLTIKNKNPLVGPREMRYFNFRDGDVYSKGAWVLHTLRHQLEDDTLFFNILRTFYDETKLKLTNSEEFIQTVNKLAGSDYRWFFNQYLFRNTVPFLEYTIRNNTLYYRWKSVNPEFNKMHINLKMDSSGEILTIIPSNEVKQVKLNGETSGKLSFDNLHALFGHESNKKLWKLYKE